MSLSAPAAEPTTAKKRLRATRACTNCRVRRSKCDSISAGIPCSHCRQGNLHCEITKDKRKSVYTKTHFESMNQRIHALEKMLETSRRNDTHAGLTDEPSIQEEVDSDAIILANHCLPLEANDIAVDLSDGPVVHDPSPQERVNDRRSWEEVDLPDLVEMNMDYAQSCSSSSSNEAPPRQPQPESFQQSGPSSFDLVEEPPMEECQRESFRRNHPNELSDIPLSLQEHLFDMYFSNFQVILQIVPEQAFREQWRIGHGPAYSKSLCLALLGAGARYSPMKDALNPYRLPEGNSKFKERSKALLESEIRHPTICTVQTLLILAEQEASGGNEMSGSMYSGLAAKLLFDLQLNLRISPPGLSQSEIETRHSLLWLAAVQDKYWALALERPCSIDNDELKLSRLVVKLSLVDSSGRQRPPVDDDDYIMQARQLMMDLTEISREVANFLFSKLKFTTSSDPYSEMRRLDRQLDRWFANLKPAFRQCPTNSSRIAQFLFFSLHLLFNSGKILLHREYAFHFSNLSRANTGSTRPVRRHLSDHSRYTCISCAIRIAQLFEGYLSKLDIRLLHSSGGQLTIFAAQAMVEYVFMLPSDEIAEPMSNFGSMRKALVEMSKSSKAVDRRLQWMDRKLSGLRSLENPLADQRLLTHPPSVGIANYRPRFSSVRPLMDAMGPPVPLSGESELSLQSYVQQGTTAGVNGRTGSRDPPATVASGNDGSTVDSSVLSRGVSNWDDLEILDRGPMMISAEEIRGSKKIPSTDFLNRASGLDGRLSDRPQGRDLTPVESFATNWDESFEPEGWVEFGL